ncbi:MAG: hypothetical protein GXO25_08325, partial [Euryarchaeota archaeon]|nr:hypothetical protein [Euryarchaeota archaeon]
MKLPFPVALELSVPNIILSRNINSWIRKEVERSDYSLKQDRVIKNFKVYRRMSTVFAILTGASLFSYFLCPSAYRGIIFAALFAFALTFFATLISYYPAWRAKKDADAVNQSLFAIIVKRFIQKESVQYTFGQVMKSVFDDYIRITKKSLSELGYEFRAEEPEFDFKFSPIIKKAVYLYDGAQPFYLWVLGAEIGGESCVGIIIEVEKES